MFTFLKSGFQKIKSALKKTSALLSSRLKTLFKRPLDQEVLEELERTLYEADLGSKTVEDLIHEVEKLHREEKNLSPESYLSHLQKCSEKYLEEPTTIQGKIPLPGMPEVILIVGINGSGKTTSIAKLASRFKEEGKKVLVAAGDTFRAAACEQLETWATKIGVDIVKGLSGGDPSSVLFDAMAKGKAKEYDVVICDTAGRLESKTDLMKELEKMTRVAKKQDPLAPHNTYLVVDASLGQTVLEQVRIFHSFVPLTGIILTKLDGSAKGGVALAIYREMKIPICFVGTGEKANDLTPFDPKAYTEALFLD